MRIHPPEFTSTDDEIIVSSQVEVTACLSPLPEHLIYRFPREYEASLNRRGDAWIAAMLPLAMHLQEDIFYQGEMSERLFYGLGELIKIFSQWLPKVFHPIQIHVSELVQSAYQPNGKTLATFTGGVDSGHVLCQHLPPLQNNPALQITHAVFIQGFDIPLQDSQDYGAWCSIFRANLSNLDVTLIPVKTNAQYFTTGRVHWINAHGCVLASVGLMLEPFCKQYLIASSWLLNMLHPWGSSIVTDHWFSTEKMAVRHSGVEANRFEETRTLSHWQPMQKMLRVCVDPRHRQLGKNCSQCEKCRRTLVMLLVQETGQLFQTFRHPPGFPDLLRWVPVLEIYAPVMVKYCWQERKFHFIPFLMIAQTRFFLKRIIRALTPQWLFNRLKALYYPLAQNLFYAANLPDDWR